MREWRRSGGSGEVMEESLACFLDAGIEEPVARVLAGVVSRRCFDAGLVRGNFAPGASPCLPSVEEVYLLPDMGVAVERLVRAVRAGEVIGLETDHDADGVTSHAILKSFLLDYVGVRPRLVMSFMGHRLRDGYGLTKSLAERILSSDPCPSLLITADNGSSDEERIAMLRSAGVDVIVTDHHELPVEGVPRSAFACVTPMRDDSRFPDPGIAGCFVACLLCMAAWGRLREEGLALFPDRRISDLLDYAALGTVADCVSLGDTRYNRWVVRLGLGSINDAARPCWSWSRQTFLSDRRIIRAEDLAFGIGPRINARGRVDEAMAGVKFLLSPSVVEAGSWGELLDRANVERKEIERILLDAALVQAGRQVKEGRYSLAVFLESGHPGVHGIVASRLVERYGLPTVILSPSARDPDLLSGSVRGIDGLHVRDALQRMSELEADLFVAFGGHKGAAGFTIRRADVERLSLAWESAVRSQLRERPGPLSVSDGWIGAGEIGLGLVDALDFLEPFGRGFASPAFEHEFLFSSVRRVGDGTHLALDLRSAEDPSVEIRGIWFGACEAEGSLPVVEGDVRRVLFSPRKDVWRGNERLSLHLMDVREPGPCPVPGVGP